MRCPVYRWREPDLGLGTEHGKSSTDAKRKPISENHEGEISMQLKMSDHPTVVLRRL
jgi:hypothetical protein